MSRKVNLKALLIAAILSFAASLSAFAAEPVILEVGADTPLIEAGKSNRVMVRALARPSGTITRRAPIVAALVIDKSGSMGADGKMENAKRGAMEALKTLAPDDYAAVVAYDTEAFVLTSVTPARDIERFAGDISRLRADGNTALYDGVEMGAREIERLVESGYIPRIILLSDGLANVGPSSSTELAALGRKLARREMTITTIGLGLDYDEDLMTALASESGGNAYFARRPDSLKDIFRRDMEDAVALSGRHVSITLSCGPAVRPIRAIGRSGRIEGDGIEVDIDNLYGTEKYVIFELEVPASENRTTHRLGTVKMEYTDPSTGEAVKLESPLEIGYAKNAGDVEKHRDIEITSQAEMAKNAEILDEAVNLADGGKSAEASEVLRERAKYLANQGYAASAPMQSDISYFNSLASDLSEGEMSNAARKSTVNRVYIQKNQQADIEGSPDGSQNK